MNVGITAANLPTLKPLFARFFTSLRTMAGSYGSRAATSTLNTPYKSTGYFRQEDQGNAESFVLSSLSKRSTVEQEWSKRGDSDESILREHGGGWGVAGGREMNLARRESIRNGGIMRTTDVVITR